MHSNLPWKENISKVAPNLFVVCPLFAFSFEALQLSGNFSVLVGKLKRSSQTMFQIEQHFFSARERKRARDVYSAVVDHRLIHGWKEAVQSGAWLCGVRHKGGICWGWVRVFPLAGGKI